MYCMDTLAPIHNVRPSFLLEEQYLLWVHGYALYNTAMIACCLTTSSLPQAAALQENNAAHCCQMLLRDTSNTSPTSASGLPPSKCQPTATLHL
jgi:hypothetical protein